MATARLARVPSRLQKLAIFGLSALVLFTSAGCKHRRSSLRPVFVEPAPTLTGPSTTIIEDDPIPSRVLPAPTVESNDSGFSPRLDPVVPPLDSKVSPSRGVSPPAPSAVDEPDLKLRPIVPALPPAERAPKANIQGPELNAPSASNAPANGGGTSLRRASVSRSRQATLKDRVRPFVNDADDLFQPPKADRPWKYIVVHHSANPSGSYDQIDRDHRKIQGWDGCGYHFVIGNGTDSPDGQIEVARRWSNQKHGLHCRNGKTPEVNEYGIGICLIGDLDDAPPTPKQVAAARALVAYLADRYTIPGQAVGSHADLADSPTACPGKHFPGEQIFGSNHVVSK